MIEAPTCYQPRCSAWPIANCPTGTASSSDTPIASSAWPSAFWDPSKTPRTCRRTCLPRPSDCISRGPCKVGRACWCAWRRCDRSTGSVGRGPLAELRDSDRMTTVEPFDEAAAGELAEWLRQSLARLPDQQAAVFAMDHFEQLSRDDVATTLGISTEAVSTALYKARQRLLDLLAVFNRGEAR